MRATAAKLSNVSFQPIKNWCSLGPAIEKNDTTAEHFFDAASPVSVARAGVDSGADAKTTAAGEEKARVVVVDDEHVIADTLKLIFLNAGMEARAVYSAEQALALMQEWLPNVAILDVHLPGMNGIDFAIHCKTAFPECKLILFSGYSSTADLLEKAGRDGYTFDVLAKPVHPVDLLRLVSRQLAGTGSDDPGGTA